MPPSSSSPSSNGAVGIVRINRPQVRMPSIRRRSRSSSTRGGLRSHRCDPLHDLLPRKPAFAAGADITQMVEAGAVDVLNDDNFARWTRFRRSTSR